MCSQIVAKLFADLFFEVLNEDSTIDSVFFLVISSIWK